MSSFTFGTPTSTASVAAPTGSSLFGTSQQPLFSTSTTTTSTTGANLFGTPTASVATSAPSTGLFGSATPATGLFGTSSSSGTGSLFGTTTVTTTKTGSFFGNTTTTAANLFGTTPASTATTNFFGKPTAGLFGSSSSSATTTTTGLLGTSGVSAPTTAVGLGGTGTLMTTGVTPGSSLGVAGAAASGNPMEADVPQVLIDLLNLLREHIRKNNEYSDEFGMNNSDSYLHMDEKVNELMGVRVKHAENIRKTKERANRLLEKMQRDVRAAEQVRRRQKEMSKNPQFTRKQTISYLLGICAEHEGTVQEFWKTLKLLEEKVSAKLNKKDVITKQDLQKHFEHYDQAFKVICSDVYRCKVQIQDLKDTFMEFRKRTMPFMPNPFERRRLEYNEKTLGETRFTGAEAFPSQVTMMKIGEMAKSLSTTQPSGGTSGLSTSGSLFGSKPFGSNTFSFNPSGSNSAAPLFKPFSATTSAPSLLFGSSTATVASAPPPAPTTTSSFTFGNTLNSSVSGTLFGGSASKPFGR